MKMTALALVTALLLPATISWAQARFEIVGGPERSFGRIPLKEFRDTLVISNPGSSTLHIAGVNPTCGCTIAELDTKVIPAGGTARVYVTIDPPDAMGHIHKTIEFLTNDLTHPKHVVGFGFEILRDLGANPPNFPFAGCRVHIPCLQSVMLYNTSDKTISIFRQPMTVPGLRSMMPDSVSIAAGDSLRYSLQLTADTTGLMTGKFRLRTTSQRNPTLEFSIFANVADKNGMPEMPHGR